MKNNICKKLLGCFTAVIMLCSCNKESYIESIGKVTMESSDETAVGHYIFTATTLTPNCQEFSIYVDEILIGKINQNNTGTINCTTTPAQNKIVRLVATEGSHKIRITFKDGCKANLTATSTIQKGKCIWYKVP